MTSTRFIFAFFLIFFLASCDDTAVERKVNESLNSIPQIQDVKESSIEANTTFSSDATYKDADDSAYEIVVRFDKDGIFYWNDMPASLGDPVQHWINTVGDPSRSSDSGTYLWDDFGLTVYTASREEVLNKPDLEDKVKGIDIRFDDRYSGIGQYSKGRDPGWSPIGYFTGLFRIDQAWIDRERKVSEFLDYESTKTLEDSFDRSLVFRDIFINSNGQKVAFSITQGLSEAFPEGPERISAYLIR